MALPTGLLPVLAFVITIGVSVPVAVTTLLASRTGTQSIRRALRLALLEASLLYLVGVVVVWAIAGGGLDTELWEIPATLVGTGIGTLLILTALPLVVGQKIIHHWRQIEPEAALRYTVAGWPTAMLITFGIFIAPGGLAQGTLFDIGGPTVCLVGFCGISLLLMGAFFLEALVVVVGPGLVGLMLSVRGEVGGGSQPIR
ncbi:hypothetical protein [Haloplanus natans]|uniref:hypothetical protein n=1 Tax=Haloplanus natans TaxID=376171 RepID=UPI0006780789|nr:hypothetical protein [Haloplanus natans]